MPEDTVRTAFTFAPILRHRTTDAARRITAISLDTAAGRIFLGLASGHVEEHQIILKQVHVDAGWSGLGPSVAGQLAPGAAASTRLVAEKRVSRQAVKSLACLPTAARLAILCEDGTAAVAAYDTWVVTSLQGVRTATAMAADPAPAAAAAAASRRPTDSIGGSAGGSVGRSHASGASKPAGAAAAAAAAAAVAPSPRPVRLAVAVKSFNTAAKLLVYSISPSLGFAAGQPPAQLLAQIPLQEPVVDLIWVGSGLFVQHAMSYDLLQPGGRITQIAEHGCMQPRMASAPWLGGPGAGGAEAAAAVATAAAAGGGGHNAAKVSASASARGALLFQDSLLLLTDGTGAAVVGSEPIQVSEPPLAICSSGSFLLVVSDSDGVLVYDRASSRLVQRIFWTHDDPWVAAARRIPVAEDAGGGGGVAVATSTAVMLLQPVASYVQARELLKRKRFDLALALIRGCRRAGEEWADTALAQAGLLMLQELRCEDALAALEEVGPPAFQPAQLLALFPRVARRWLPGLPHRSYWGLDGSLQSLDRICDDFLELRNSTGSSPQRLPSPPASIGSSPAYSLLPPGLSPEPSNHTHNHHQHLHHHSHSQGARLHQHHQRHHPQTGLAAAAAVAGGSSPGDSAAAGGGGDEVAALAADAKRHIVTYLMRNRALPGVQCLEGIDTLLVHLLVDIGETGALEAFLAARDEEPEGAPGPAAAVEAPVQPDSATPRAAAPSAATAAGVTAAPATAVAVAFAGVKGPPAQVSTRDSELVAVLEGSGRWHALAVLRAARGQVPQALELWQRLALREVAEAPSTSGAVAVEAAAAAATAATAARPADSPPTPRAAATAPADREASPADSGALASAAGSSYDSLWEAAAAAVAAASAAALMALPARTPPLLCLSKLPWLLHAAPDGALHVMRSRQLPVADVMSLLQGRSDGVRWQYLHHLVYGASGDGDVRRSGAGAVRASGSGPEEGPAELYGGADVAAAPWHLDPSLHTELALELIECVAILQARIQQIQQIQHQHQDQQLVGSGPTAESGTIEACAAVAAADVSGGDRTAAPAPSSAFAAAAGAAALYDGADAGDVATASLELAPALPLLPVPTSRQLSAAADAAGAAAARTCTSPPLPARAMLHATSSSLHPQPQPLLSPRASRPDTSGHPATHPHGHGHGHHHHHRPHHGQQQQQHRPHDPHHTHQHPHSHGHQRSTSPRATRAHPLGDGVSLLPPDGTTTGSGPRTAELAWLATIGALPVAAAARQLKLAVRGAMAAAGHDLDAAGDGNGGGGGGSLSLLRALSYGGNGGGIGSLAGLRAVLQHHLYASTLYDAAIVLQAVGGSSAARLLLREVVQLHCRLADHPAALAVIALQLLDVDGAITYCRAQCGQEGWLALLDTLLRPGGGREPDYSAACRVLAAEGAALAPLQVLEALSDDMPLHLAHGTLSRMVGSVLHRKRQGQVMRALHRAQNLALRAELAQLQAWRVVVSDETLCRGCQRPLTTKVFYRYPSGVVMCARCARPDTESSSG